MMPHRHEGLTQTLRATAAIAKFRIVKQAGLETVTQASAASDKLFGVSREAAGAANDPIDIIVEGVAYVDYGGTIAVGDWLTADGDGKAVAAATTAASTGQVIGKAQIAGVTGDTGSVHLEQGQRTVPAA